MPIPPSQEDHLYKRILDEKPKADSFAPAMPTPYSPDTAPAAIAANGVVAVYKGGGGELQKPWN